MNKGTILVVEDDPTLREVLCETLQLAKYTVATAENGQDALREIKRNTAISLVVSDVQMRPMDGHQLLQSVKQMHPKIPVILMTAFGTVEKAVSAMHDGAVDYLVKPFEADALVELVARFVIPGIQQDESFVAVDIRSQELARVARRVAATDTTVMLSGESGVGKEVVSRYIHTHSSRSQGPFVAINCAAIPENMLESVLFGYEKGAFTGAHQAKAGKFEQAQGGTLLLDEITEMDLGLQAKLLRVLQEKEVERLGSHKVIALDVRILATTNRNMREAVTLGQFREDLFYRLNVFPLTLLPLRERPDDILPLTQRLLSSYGDVTANISIADDAVSVLMGHNWPGNVRELDNVIQRALILKSGQCIEANDIRFEQVTGMTRPARDDLAEPVFAVKTNEQKQDAPNLNSNLRNHETHLIISALRAKNSRSEVAEKLGISPRTLRYKLARLRDAGVTLPA